MKGVKQYCILKTHDISILWLTSPIVCGSDHPRNCDTLSNQLGAELWAKHATFMEGWSKNISNYYIAATWSPWSDSSLALTFIIAHAETRKAQPIWSNLRVYPKSFNICVCIASQLSDILLVGPPSLSRLHLRGILNEGLLELHRVNTEANRPEPSLLVRVYPIHIYSPVNHFQILCCFRQREPCDLSNSSEFNKSSNKPFPNVFHH